VGVDASEAVPADGGHPGLLERVARLEEQVEALRLQLLEMRRGPPSS
jgi:hypothetical protein